VAAHQVVVTRACLTLSRVVREAIPGTSWNRARELCRTGRVSVDGERVLDPELHPEPGAVVEITPEGPKLRGGVLPLEDLVHVDADVVVVNKPAGLLSVPFEEGDRDTLIDRTRAALRRRGPRGVGSELGIVHRIDVDTTGLLVFTRNLAAKRHLAQQFRAHTVHRRYLALAHGCVLDARLESLLLRDRGDGLRGSYGHFKRPRGPAPKDAQRAVTHVRRLAQLRGASLVECALETGRQHQIRIHLSEAGHPLVGERVYVRDYAGPRIEAARPMLHAQELGFVHPRTGRDLRFTVDPPEDFASLRLRLSRGES
jgi:23S rRNA pseudouridine1911/1915/1917 synthase